MSITMGANNLKTVKRIALIIITLCVMGIFFFIGSIKLAKPVSTVLLVDKKYEDNIKASIQTAQQFFDPYSKALDAVNAGKVDLAVEYLNTSLSHAKSKNQMAMVYSELARIYQKNGNLEMELKYQELLSKYSMNDAVIKGTIKRAAELRQILKTQQAGEPQA